MHQQPLKQKKSSLLYMVGLILACLLLLALYLGWGMNSTPEVKTITQTINIQ